MIFSKTLIGFASLLIIGAVFIALTSFEPNSSLLKQIHEGEFEKIFLTNPISTLVHHTHDISKPITGEGHGVLVDSEVIVVEEDMWLTEIEPVVENAPLWTLHHMALVDVDTKNIVCTDLYDILFIVGQDAKPKISLPKPYGIFLKKGQRVQVKGMLHNPDAPTGSGVTYENVSAGFKLHFTEDGKDRTKPVSFFLVETDDPPHCQNDYVFTVPPRTQSFVKESDLTAKPSQTYLSFPTDWTMVGISAHLHAWQGGKRLKVFLNKDQIYDFRPKRISESPEIWESQTDMPLRHINANDVVSLSAEYQNLSSNSVEGVMGVIGVYYHVNK